MYFDSMRKLSCRESRKFEWIMEILKRDITSHSLLFIFIDSHELEKNEVINK